jgi:four helix bundle protein
MTPEEMKRRTKSFAVQVLRFVDRLPEGRSVNILARQLVTAGTSVGSNYRAACIARSKREFNAKLQICLEEADESAYWLEVLKDSGLSDGPDREGLLSEAKELTAIFVSSLKTSRRTLES